MRLNDHHYDEALREMLLVGGKWTKLLFASKEVGFGSRGRRVVDHHHEHFAPKLIGIALIIIPVVLRCVDTVTDKNKLRIYRDVVSLGAGRRHEIVAKFERFVSGFPFDLEAGIVVGFDANQWDILKIAPLICRSYAARLHLIGDVVGGLSPAIGSRPSTLKIISGKPFNAFTYLISVEFRGKVL